METMRYQEKKKSYKGAIIGFFLFVVIGGGLIVFALQEEKAPELIGKSKEESQSLVDVKDNQEAKDMASIDVKVTDKVIKDTETAKLKGNITLPQITIDGEALTELNDKIVKEYQDRFASLKETMKNGENKFTYQVTYHQYDNTVAGRRMLSLTVHQSVMDDTTKKSTTDKVETYNIDVETKKTVSLADIEVDMLGKEYKETIKNALKQYVISKGMMKEAEFNYTVTGLENYYIKDGKLHMIFNEGELVNKKYNVVDITIE